MTGPIGWVVVVTWPDGFTDAAGLYSSFSEACEVADARRVHYGGGLSVEPVAVYAEPAGQAQAFTARKGWPVSVTDPAYMEG